MATAGVSPAQTLPPEAADAIRRLAKRLPEARMVTPDLVRQLGCDPLLLPEDGMVAAVHGELGPVALFRVTERLGDVGRFTPDDLAVFSSLADQLGLALISSHRSETIASLQQLGEELAYRATHDPLTGLADRSVLQDALDAALAAGEPTTLLYLDLDGFKAVNDTFGHEVGDVVLQAVAERVRSEVRAHDIVARLGGDEFAVALVGATEVGRLADRLVESIGQHIAVPGGTARVGVSIGVVQCAPAADHSAAIDVLRQGDAAMYAAKAAGKNTVVWYRSGIAVGDRSPQTR